MTLIVPETPAPEERAFAARLDVETTSVISPTAPALATVRPTFTLYLLQRQCSVAHSLQGYSLDVNPIGTGRWYDARSLRSLRAWFPL